MPDPKQVWLDNAAALIRQEFEPVMTAVADYEAGKKAAELLADEELAATVRRYGTRIEAVVEYIEANCKQKKSPRRKKRADSEEE